MSIQEIGRNGKSSKEQIQEYPDRRKKEHSEVFQESLMQNLKYQGEAQGRESEEKRRLRTSGKEDRPGIGRIGVTAGIRVNTITKRDVIQAVEVRHMSYEESDNIEIAVTEGYTLKGKREGNHVYVEAKYDDGRLEAYQVDPRQVQAQTQHRIEQFAVETAAGGK